MYQVLTKLSNIYQTIDKEKSKKGGTSATTIKGQREMTKCTNFILITAPTILYCFDKIIKLFTNIG